MEKPVVAGIIAEYNPLHNGHIYHLEKTRELTGCDLVVAVMSGNFVQRGEFAVTDKWTRAAEAVRQGVNLVLELPFPFVVQSATQFGAQSVKILNMAKADYLVFGSETNNIEELKEISSMSFNIDNFRENMKAGYSYPYSYGFMADSYGPNDILAMSYLRALNDYPDMKPVSILRKGSNYNDEEISSETASARAIRKALREGKDVSAYTPMSFDKLFPNSFERLYPYIRMILLTTPGSELKEFFLMDEGIENHLIRCAQDNLEWAGFISQATTRRYTTSRIQRTLCHLAVRNTRENMNRLPELDRIRPLDWDDKGQDYIRYLQESGVTVVNHFAQIIQPYRELEYKAALLYSMFMNAEDTHRIVKGEVCGRFLGTRY